MDEHPLLKWAGSIFGVITIIAFVFGVWWYFQDEKLRNERWFQDDTAWNSELLIKQDDIIARQAEILQKIAVLEKGQTNIKDIIIIILSNKSQKQLDDLVERMEAIK